MKCNRQGKYIEDKIKKYKYFSPSLLPIKLNLTENLYKLLIEVHGLLNKMNELSVHIPNKELFITSYINKEALLSSRIEGTQCSLIDIFDISIDENTNLDKLDVINYVRALKYGIDNLTKLPLSSRLFKQMHSILLQNVRGKNKEPGEYRKSQNWIGGSNSTIANAKFIPPNIEIMYECISNLEKYINDDFDNYDPLIKIALIHYQFETIHPFLDGNGRIGRMIIVLYLIEKKILSCPIIYVSYFLKLEQQEYYMHLDGIRENGFYEEWIKFFLTALKVCLNQSINLTKELKGLFELDESIINKQKANKNIIKIFDFIKNNPITNVSIVSKNLSLSFNAAHNVLNKLVELNIINISLSKKRNRIYSYEKYLNLLQKDIII